MIESYLVLLCAGLSLLRFGVGLPPNYTIHPELGLELSYFDDEESKEFLARLREFISSNHISKTDIQGSATWHVDFEVWPPNPSGIIRAHSPISYPLAQRRQPRRSG